MHHIHIYNVLALLLLLVSSGSLAKKVETLNASLVKKAQLQQQKLIESYGLSKHAQWQQKCHDLITQLDLNQFDQCLVLKASFINAYSLAHGTVILTEGLLENINNDDQLAHVLAHEHSHLSLNHHHQTQVLLSDPPKLFTKSRIKKFYREIEQQADQTADQLLIQMGRDSLQIHHYLIRIETNSNEVSNDHQKLKNRIQRDNLPEEVIEDFWRKTKTNHKHTSNN